MLLLQRARRFQGEVAEDAVAAGAFEAHQGFQHHRFALQPALLEGGIALQQLWLFWLAPLIGAAVAGVVYRWFEE